MFKDLPCIGETGLLVLQLSKQLMINLDSIFIW